MPEYIPMIIFNAVVSSLTPPALLPEMGVPSIILIVLDFSFVTIRIRFACAKALFANVPEAPEPIMASASIAIVSQSRISVAATCPFDIFLRFCG